MFESKTQIDTLECELTEEDLKTVVGGLFANGDVYVGRGQKDLFPDREKETESKPLTKAAIKAVFDDFKNYQDVWV